MTELDGDCPNCGAELAGVETATLPVGDHGFACPECGTDVYCPRCGDLTY